jgi:hypothetical protein
MKYGIGFVFDLFDPPSRGPDGEKTGGEGEYRERGTFLSTLHLESVLAAVVASLPPHPPLYFGTQG